MGTYLFYLGIRNPKIVKKLVEIIQLSICIILCSDSLHTVIDHSTCL